MKIIKLPRLLFTLGFLFFFPFFQSFGQAPFQRGVNLSGWFQAESVRQVQFTKYTRHDFENIKGLGCDVVRLPINLHAMTTDRPVMPLDPLFLQMLDQVADWCEELDLYLILDNHSFDPAVTTDPQVEQVLLSVWTQMATHFRDRPENLYYEILNEPRGISDQVWGRIQGTVIEAIRAVDTRHTLVVGGANWNSYQNLQHLPVYADPKILYTFHFYDPFVFTHQGASWSDPSLETLANVPFPYQASAMPSTPPALRGTWIEGALQNYPSEGTVAKIKESVEVAVAFRNQRQVNVFCGEFGVYRPNSQPAERTYWYGEVRRYFEEKNIPWTIWDYQGGFGLFEPNTPELFNHNLNLPLLRALGFTEPAQTPYVASPKTSGFTLYDDYVGSGLEEGSWFSGGQLDYYNASAPKEGIHSLYWSGVSQYDAINLLFKPETDLSLLVNQGYSLRFWVKGGTPATKFDVRFVDSKTGPADRPWRMGITIDHSRALMDGAWQLVEISLRGFQEKGGYDNAYYPPEGKFDWKAVAQFQIVPEHQPLTGIEFWFDGITVAAPQNPTGILNEEAGPVLPAGFPNPFTHSVTIAFSLPHLTDLDLSVYDLRGRKVATLFRGQAPAGSHRHTWNRRTHQGTVAAAGLYLLKTTYSGNSHVSKLLVQDVSP